MLTGRRDDCNTPEYALRELPKTEAAREHSAGLLREQPPDPDFWVDFNKNNVNARACHIV